MIDINLPVDFMLKYVAFILDNFRVGGVPVYLIILVLVAVGFSLWWLQFLVSAFLTRYGGD